MFDGFARIDFSDALQLSNISINAFSKTSGSNSLPILFKTSFASCEKLLVLIVMVI